MLWLDTVAGGFVEDFILDFAAALGAAFFLDDFDTIFKLLESSILLTIEKSVYTET